MAPEIILGAGYSLGVDIWSLGITAFEMIDGDPPYGDKKPMEAMRLIVVQGIPPPKSNCSSNFIQFLRTCLQKDPNQRPSSSKLMQHPFFKSRCTPEEFVNLLRGYKIKTNRKSIQIDERKVQTLPALSAQQQSPDKEKLDNLRTQIFKIIAVVRPKFAAFQHKIGSVKSQQEIAPIIETLKKLKQEFDSMKDYIKMPKPAVEAPSKSAEPLERFKGVGTFFCQHLLTCSHEVQQWFTDASNLNAAVSVASHLKKIMDILIENKL
eukprot:TRINITY_DN2117_c0_g1_i1.p1 TRINITY_DN2117_c0_g1~~TRINITY_DN2117_c0_g1_i1.p1  ORF type:complete len:265 (-),score=35.91 TRINITY_DN2117_c0_g1_i1:9-803(-)